MLRGDRPALGSPREHNLGRDSVLTKTAPPEQGRASVSNSGSIRSSRSSTRSTLEAGAIPDECEVSALWQDSPLIRASRIRASFWSTHPSPHPPQRLAWLQARQRWFAPRHHSCAPRRAAVRTETPAEEAAPTVSGTGAASAVAAPSRRRSRLRRRRCPLPDRRSEQRVRPDVACGLHPLDLCSQLVLRVAVTNRVRQRVFPVHVGRSWRSKTASSRKM